MPDANALSVSLSLNWIAGWAMILASFITGAIVGLFFHQNDFLGGYLSFPRRLIRLGHIALAALGMMNLLLALAPVPMTPTLARSASWLLLAGGIVMPVVCFLTAWRPSARHWFPIPVTLLVLAVACIISGSFL